MPFVLFSGLLTGHRVLLLEDYSATFWLGLCLTPSDRIKINKNNHKHGFGGTPISSLVFCLTLLCPQLTYFILEGRLDVAILPIVEFLTM